MSGDYISAHMRGIAHEINGTDYVRSGPVARVLHRVKADLVYYSGKAFRAQGVGWWVLCGVLVAGIAGVYRAM